MPGPFPARLNFKGKSPGNKVASSRYENRPMGSVKQQSRRDSRNIKDSGEKVWEMDQSQTTDICQQTITSRFPRTEENRLHLIVINPLLTVTYDLLQHLHPIVIMGSTLAVLQILRRSINYSASPTARENNRSLNNSLSLIDTTQEAADMLLDLYNDCRK